MLIPSIDLMDGKIVQLVQGERVNETADCRDTVGWNACPARVLPNAVFIRRQVPNCFLTQGVGNFRELSDDSGKALIDRRTTDQLMHRQSNRCREEIQRHPAVRYERAQ